MEIQVKTRIQRNIDDVWTQFADEFTQIAVWSDSVVESVPLSGDGAGGAPMAGRVCSFTDDPNGFKARETILAYDRDAHTLVFDVVPIDAPAALPLRKNVVTVTLTETGSGETELVWTAVPELKAHGYLLYPAVKAGMTKAFRNIVAEFKAYAEGGALQAAS
jgi:hypothetical protein